VRLRVPVSEADHVQGPANAPLELIEYGDYECPFCRQAYDVVQRTQRAFGHDLRFVFRNVPLTQFLPHAMNAARAAEAAALQNRFWEMHDTLYENQENLDDESLLAYAAALDLNLKRFADDMFSPQVDERILSDLEGGARSGVNGTPTFFISGFRFDGDWTQELPYALEAVREEMRASHR
jgi:protein-disulfide isomerase